MRPKFIGILAVLTLALAGCGDHAGPVIDGWSIGEEFDCSGPRCGELLSVAEQSLDALVPGHAAVTASTFHSEGLYMNDDGQLTTSTSFATVVRFKLADGTIRAIGVGRPKVGDGPAYALGFGPCPSFSTSHCR
jgi:hypothetical protein